MHLFLGENVTTASQPYHGSHHLNEHEITLPENVFTKVSTYVANYFFSKKEFFK